MNNDSREQTTRCAAHSAHMAFLFCNDPLETFIRQHASHFGSSIKLLLLIITGLRINGNKVNYEVRIAAMALRNKNKLDYCFQPLPKPIILNVPIPELCILKAKAI